MNRVVAALTLALLVSAGAASPSARQGAGSVAASGGVSDASGGALQGASMR
jgi:hypothetical protein